MNMITFLVSIHEIQRGILYLNLSVFAVYSDFLEKIVTEEICSQSKRVHNALLSNKKLFSIFLSKTHGCCITQKCDEEEG